MDAPSVIALQHGLCVGERPSLRPRLLRRGVHLQVVLAATVFAALGAGAAVAAAELRAGDHREEAANWRAKGEVLQRSGRGLEAEVYYRRALAPDAAAAISGDTVDLPEDAAVLNNLGVLARERGDIAEAESWYSRASRADPSLGAAWANLGQAMLARGAVTEAVPTLRRGIELGYPALHRLLGHAMLATSSLEANTIARKVRQHEAESSFQEASRLHVQPTAVQQHAEASAEAPRRARASANAERVGAKHSRTSRPSRGRNAKSLDPDLHAVTIATRAGEPGLEMLLHSAEAAGIPIWVRGADAKTLRAWGTEAGGWGIKLRAMADVARRARSPDSLVLWVDAYDVLFSPAATPALLRRRFEAMEHPVVLAAEGHCVPAQGNCVGQGGDTNGDSYPTQPYLNSGVLLARAGPLLQLLERYPFKDPVDDQAYFGYMWQKERGRVLVDTARKLVACPFRAIHAAGSTYALTGPAWPQGPPDTEELVLRPGGGIEAVGPDGSVRSEPLLLHFNGPARTLMEPAYKALFPSSFRASQASPGDAWRPVAIASESAAAPSPPPPRAMTRLLGTPLSEGPWSCEASLLQRKGVQAALCAGGEVLIDQVYVANLERRPDRLREIDAELRRHGLRAVRFPAIDGNGISKSEQERHDKSAIRGIPKGHLGCFFTHVAMWREVKRLGWRSALLLEDDAAGVEEQLVNLRSRLHEMRTLDPNWHFVYLGRNPVEVSRALLMNEGILSHWPARRDKRLSDNIVDPGTSEGLWAYLISAAGAEVLVPVFDAMIEAGVTYDVDLSLHFESPRKALRMYAFEPPLLRQREADGFSDTSQVARGRKQLLLGHQFMQAGKFSEAERRLREALRATEGSGPDADLWVQEMKRYLAASLARQSQRVGDKHAREAESIFRSALDLAAIEGGGAAKALAGTASDLCHFISTQGRFEEAHGLCRRALDVAAGTGRKEDACAAHGYMGILFDIAGRHAEAEKSFRQAVAVGEEGVRESRLCTDLANLCTFLRQRGRHAEAEEPCTRCPAVVDVKAAHAEE